MSVAPLVGQTSFSGSTDGYRILLSLGFGKDNVFTDEFGSGTAVRQKSQQAKMISRHQESEWSRRTAALLDHLCWRAIAQLQRSAPQTFERIKHSNTGGGF